MLALSLFWVFAEQQENERPSQRRRDRMGLKITGKDGKRETTTIQRESVQLKAETEIFAKDKRG